MSKLLMNLLLALVWIALTGRFGPANFILGFLLASLLLWLTQGTGRSTRYFRKLWGIVYFVLFLLWELVRANSRVAFDVVTPRHHMHPSIVAIPLDLESDAEITMLANLITLTPGSLTLDLSSDRRVLYVHDMYVQDPEAFRLRIKSGFERRVKELYR